MQPALAAGDAAFVRTIFLVRHGAYLPDTRADPKMGPGLSTLGIAQARLAAARFRSMPLAFDSITSSTMARAQQTAAIVQEQAGAAAASSSPLISECTPPAGGELRQSASAMNACKQQLDTAFAQFFTPATGANRNDVLVCHGNVIRYLVTKALGVDTRAWTGLSIAHASLTIVQVHASGAFQVIAVGDTGHIPANMQSWGDDADPHLVAPAIQDFERR